METAGTPMGAYDEAHFSSPLNFQILPRPQRILSPYSYVCLFLFPSPRNVHTYLLYSVFSPYIFHLADFRDIHFIFLSQFRYDTYPPLPTLFSMENRLPATRAKHPWLYFVSEKTHDDA